MESIMPTHTTAKPLPVWVLVPGFIFVALLFVVTFSEWVTIGLLKDPAVIAQYPFGSEEAMSDGGWYYKNAELYARQMLIDWVIFLLVLGVFGWAGLRRSGQRIATAYALLVLTILLSNLINQLHSL